MLNGIYSAVVSGKIATDDLYYKKHTACNLTNKAKKLQAIILDAVPATHIGLMGSVISWMSRYTAAAGLVNELDSNNTYAAPTRLGGLTIWQYIPAIETLKRSLQYLDDDLVALLDTPTCFDYMTCICIQILREANDN